jgi:Colicin V production protein
VTPGSGTRALQSGALHAPYNERRVFIMVVNLLMLAILFACAAMLYNDGLWSNSIRLINTITAGLLAMNFFEPAADWMETQAPAYGYFCDFISLWGLFTIFSLIFRLITDKLSPVKVKFLKMADQVGSGVLALWVGWVMVCFTLVSLHAAPLARNCLNESFQPEEKMFFGFAPDRQWLGFTQKMSQEAFARSATEADWKAEKTIFDPHGKFLTQYATRRATLESNVKDKGSLTVKAGP